MKRLIFSLACLVLSLALPAFGGQQKKQGASLYEIKRDGKIGFINRQGKEVIPPRYDDVRGGFMEGLTRIQVDDLWGFMDRSGRVVVSPVYDDNDEFSEGLARVRSKKKWGFVDHGGKVKIPLEFEDAGNFRDGMAKVKINGRWGFVDKAGRKVVPAQYKDVDDFTEGLARIKSDGKWGYVARAEKSPSSLPLKAPMPSSTDWHGWKWTGKRDTSIIPAASSGDRSSIDPSALLNPPGTAIERMIPMAKFLIVYSTTDGQTRKICHRLQQVVEQQGHQVAMVPVEDADRIDLASFDKIIIGASIRYGKHSPSSPASSRKTAPSWRASPTPFSPSTSWPASRRKASPNKTPTCKNFSGGSPGNPGNWPSLPARSITPVIPPSIVS